MQDAFIYTFPISVVAIPVAVALVFAAAGTILLYKRKPLPLVLIVFGISAAVGGVFVPTLAMDRVVLDDEKLEQTTGFWFAPTVKGFRLADVASITIRTATHKNNIEYEVWVIQTRDGQTQEIDPGDLWVMNTPDILGHLRANGLRIDDQTKP